MKIATNESGLITQILTGEVWPPLSDRHSFRVGPDGQPFVLPGMGGVTLGVHCGDPATGYAGAQRAERLLGNAVLLTVNSYGHPIELPSTCADKWRVRYLVNLVTPPPGTVCGAQRPFR